MSLFDDGRRNATVRAAVKTEALVLPGDVFKAMLEEDEAMARRVGQQIAARRRINQFVEGQKAGFGAAVDMYSAVASFLIEEGLGDATDALLIDETLCIGCDNCETACAETHQGVSRLDREAGSTFAHLHVPTSCRHCEHPHCMADCPPNAIHRAPDGEVFITDACIGCGNCQRNCPYGVIQMERTPPPKPNLLQWLLLGLGPGPGQPDPDWVDRQLKRTGAAPPKVAVKCDMCKGVDGGPACVRACPTGAAIRVAPDIYLQTARQARTG
jgi:Fe-S-cluster-containing hydrogenase component 2